MRRFSRVLGIAKLLPRLGLVNIFRVGRHRTLLKLRIHPVCRLKADIGVGPFFDKVASNRNLLASKAWTVTLKYFDWFEVPIPAEGKPNWFSKPFSGGVDWPSNEPWWKPDASQSSEGDIKEVWDLSRFNWVLAMAQRAVTGDNTELSRLNEWLADWSNRNPPYMGPNWGCGQEAAIRVMHCAVAAVILEQDRSPSPAVLSFIQAHLARIESTLGYALSQDNNHGILEAAGLFVGGEWLYATSKTSQARKWAELGRKWLEERARRLIASDGSFSMYSVAYHREFLDALVICEFWRKRFECPRFTDGFLKRATGAALWLKAFTNPASGDVPNIGANDGTRLFPLVDTDYRDFRPAVQMACIVFAGARAYSTDGSWNLPLSWLGVPLPGTVLPEDSSMLFNESGFARLSSYGVDTNSQAFVRYPRFRFRPSHAEGLHLDFWMDGENVLRDGGTFSYDPKLGFADYFMGIQSHNTVQFDQREQMPRLSRFLFGAWSASGKRHMSKHGKEGAAFEVSYEDHKAANHLRRVTLTSCSLEVEDTVRGFHQSAVLRWRLQPGDWMLNGTILSDGKFELSFSSDVQIFRAEVVTGWESRYYFNIEKVPVLEVEIRQPGILKTQFGFKK